MNECFTEQNTVTTYYTVCNLM